MSRKNYIKDYKVESGIDGRGRIRYSAHYAGEYYDFTRDGRAVQKGRVTVCAACILAWAAYIAALIPWTNATHQLYFTLPFIFSAIPLFLLSEAAVLLFTSKRPFIHRTADKFTKRFLPCAVALAVFSAGAAIGFIAGLLAHAITFSPAEAVPAVSSVILFASAAAALSVRNSFEVAAVSGRSAPKENSDPEQE